jgi:hypothetical protein
MRSFLNFLNEPVCSGHSDEQSNSYQMRIILINQVKMSSKIGEPNQPFSRLRLNHTERAYKFGIGWRY